MSTETRQSSRFRRDADDDVALRAFGEVLEQKRDEVDAAVRAAATRIPIFVALLETMDPELERRTSEQNNVLQRRALLESDWSEYLENLELQGAMYAQFGVEFRDWFELLSPYREVIYGAALDEPDRSRTLLVLRGLGRFLDIVVAALAASYIDTKEDLLRAQERELARHVRELQRSNRELDDFAYVASHDLKAPLRDVQTLAEWIADDAADSLSPESRRHLGLLRDRVGRMERLLGDLLAYSRVGRVSEESESVEVREAIDAAARLVIPVEGFAFTVVGDGPTLETSRAALETVLRNLIGNAVKHHGGAAGRIDVCVAQRPDHVEFAVTDDGPGIPAELHAKAFRLFETLRPRDEVEGSGMGLAIVKKIVEHRGGRVGIESATGHGTTVRFTWPSSPGAAS